MISVFRLHFNACGEKLCDVSRREKERKDITLIGCVPNFGLLEHTEGHSVCRLFQHSPANTQVGRKWMFSLQHLVVKTPSDATRAALPLNLKHTSAQEPNKDVH